MNVTHFAYMSGETIAEIQQLLSREIESIGSENHPSDTLTEEQYQKIHSLEVLLEGANNLVSYCNERYYAYKEGQKTHHNDREDFS